MYLLWSLSRILSDLLCRPLPYSLSWCPHSYSPPSRRHSQGTWMWYFTLPTLLPSHPPCPQILSWYQLPSLECYSNLSSKPVIEDPPRPCFLPQQHRLSLQYPLRHPTDYRGGFILHFSSTPHARVHNWRRKICHCQWDDHHDKPANSSFCLIFPPFRHHRVGNSMSRVRTRSPNLWHLKSGWDGVH